MGMCMKKKYFITVISIIAAIAVGIISFPFLVKLKSNYEYSVAKAKRNKAFKEMIAFCEENQKEIETYSNRYISMKSPDMSYKELEKLEKQIAKELEENNTITLYENTNIIKITVAEESIKAFSIPKEFLTFYYELSEEEMSFCRSLVE